MTESGNFTMKKNIGSGFMRYNYWPTKFRLVIRYMYLRSFNILELPG